MFDNLIQLINGDIPFTDNDTALFQSVSPNPDLSFFDTDPRIKPPENPDEIDPEKRSPLDLDKASLLRLLQCIVFCAQDNSSRHKAECDNFITGMNTKNTLKKLIEQFPSFQKVVLVETILVLQTYPFAALTDPQYITTLVTQAINAPPHLKNLFCFPILQFLKMGDVWRGSISAPAKLPETAIEILSDDLFSPVLFGQFITLDGSQMATKIIQKYDLFKIFLDQWIGAAEALFEKNPLIICYLETQYYISNFLKLYHKSLTAITYASRILPLMAAVVKRSPLLFEQILKDNNIYALQQLESQFPAVLQFSAAAANCPTNAEIVLAQFTNRKNRSEPLLGKLFVFLRQALQEVVSTKVSESAQDAFLLLQRFCKYLSYETLNSFIECFCSSQIDDARIAFVSFLFEFFENRVFASHASKALASITQHYPDIVFKFFVDKSSFLKYAKIMDNNSTVARAFVDVASDFINFWFNRTSPFKEIPAFSLFMMKEYYPDSIYKKYEQQNQRWKTLCLLSELVFDMCTYDKNFASSIQNDLKFTRCLISGILAAANVIQNPSEPTKESKTHRIDRDHHKYIIQYASCAMALMIYLVNYNLTERKSLSLLCQLFFKDNSEGTTLFSTFVSFLEFKHPLASKLRMYSIQMIELMCDVASLSKGISVDAFYPRNRQEVLLEGVRTNIFKADDINQTINELNFIANTLSTQTAFAYSFVRMIGSSFLITATEKTQALAAECPELVLSMSRLLSQMWIKLNPDAKVVQQISSKSYFWNSLIEILKLKTVDYNIIAAKAYYLHCFICDTQNIGDDVVHSLFHQLQLSLPTEEYKHVYPSKHVDFSQFVIPKKHRTYGESFYFDADLADRYFIDDEEIADFIKKLNKTLSTIHASTQLLSSLLGLVRSRDQSNLLPSVHDSLRIVCRMIEQKITPDSSIQLAFELLDLSLSLKSEFLIDRMTIRFLTNFIYKKPIEYALGVIGKLFAACEIEDFCDILMILKPCLRYAAEHKSKPALYCCTELALKLCASQQYIYECYEEFRLILTLVETPLACEVLDLFTIVFYNGENTTEFKRILSFSFLNQLSCNTDPNSKQWPHLFSLLTSLAETSEVAYDYIFEHFDIIIFFMSPTAAESLEQLHMYRIQTKITDLMLHLSANIKEFAEQNPSIYKGIKEMVQMKLKSSMLFLRESPHLTFDGQPDNWTTYNSKTCNLWILYYCLSICCEILTTAEINTIGDIINKVIEMVHGMFLPNSPFTSLMIQVFEISLNLYFIKISAQRNNGHGKPDTVQSREERDSIIKSINLMISLINKSEHKEDYTDSIKFLDTINDYLCKLQ